MTTSVAPRQLERLESQLTALRNGAIRFEQSFADELARIDHRHRASARNLLH